MSSKKPMVTLMFKYLDYKMIHPTVHHLHSIGRYNGSVFLYIRRKSIIMGLCMILLQKMPNNTGWGNEWCSNHWMLHWTVIKRHAVELHATARKYALEHSLGVKQVWELYVITSLCNSKLQSSTWWPLHTNAYQRFKKNPHQNSNRNLNVMIEWMAFL